MLQHFTSYLFYCIDKLFFLLNFFVLKYNFFFCQIFYFQLRCKKWIKLCVSFRLDKQRRTLPCPKIIRIKLWDRQIATKIPRPIMINIYRLMPSIGREKTAIVSFIYCKYTYSYIYIYIYIYLKFVFFNIYILT